MSIPHKKVDGPNPRHMQHGEPEENDKRNVELRRNQRRGGHDKVLDRFTVKHQAWGLSSRVISLREEVWLWRLSPWSIIALFALVASAARNASHSSFSRSRWDSLSRAIA
jgi:hypothetical protein